MVYNQFSVFSTWILLLSVFTLNAQVNRDASYYLDDNGISTSKNSVGFNFSAVINGDVPFVYERKIGDRLRLSAGVGMVLPFYSFNLNSGFSDEPEPDEFDPYNIENRGFGSSYILQAKFFGLNEKYERLYVGYYHRHKSFDVTDKGKVTYTDNMVTQGYLFNLKQRLQLDVGAAFGFRKITKNFDNEIQLANGFDIAFTLNVLLAYIF